MEPFEFPEPASLRRKRKTSSLVWNVLTILVLVTILCVLSVFFLIYVDPNSSLNPFPPPTLYPSLAAPTFTVTPRITLIPSWTPTNSGFLEVGDPQTMDVATSTAEPVEIASVGEPTTTPIPDEFAFTVQEGSPSAIAWSTFHPNAGCDWSGVAGQATNLSGNAVQGLFVKLGGTLSGTDSVDKQVMTGLAAEYGAGGFEFTLANSLIATSRSLWIQLVDPQNLPLSDRIYFDTYAECEKNLVIIQLEQVR